MRRREPGQSAGADRHHPVAISAKCSECDETQMCVQLRCHGCMICRRCMTRLIEIIRRDCD